MCQRCFVAHFGARALTLIALPLALYALFFAVPRLSVWEQMLPLLRLCLAARRLSQHPSIRGNREEDLRVLKERIDEITLRLTQLSRQLYERIWVPVCGGESEEDVAFESVDVSQMKLTQTSTQAHT